jgi:arylsulfatase A-like enzyme
LDTTRADHLGCYGYTKPTSAHLDHLASKGVLFTQAIAQASVTPVSHASILTGLNPYTHGLRVMHGVTENRLADSQVTLAEVLGKSGYHTAAFVSAFPVAQRFGLHQGFDKFDADFLLAPPEQLVSEEGLVNTGMNQRRADVTTDRALAWLAKAPSPFFLWLHYFDPHDPKLLPPEEVVSRYGPAPAGATEREVFRILYDIEIEYMDQHIGRVLDWLQQSGSWAKTIVVVVADHGEGLGDHNWWTHGILYQEQVRVPLIIRAPSLPGARRIDHLVRTIDIMPTLLDLAGLGSDAAVPMEGHSLVPLMKGGAPDPGYVAYCDSVNTLTYGFSRSIRDVKDDMLFAMVSYPWKYIYHVRRTHESELYNLDTDTGEHVNVRNTNPEVVKRLKADLMARKCIPARQVDDQWGMSPEDLERLRSLGYIGD